MKYYIIAGEASGDLHAANLMRSILKQDAAAEFRFFGGDLMAEVGGRCVMHYREMAFMGLLPVLMHIPAILRNLSLCKRDIVDFRPDAVILVDYPGFNLKIAKYVKKRLPYTPVFYYISPKVWAWKEYRVKSFKKYVDVMLSILPFEVEFYKKHHYNVHYVGNPIVDAIDRRPYAGESFRQFTEVNGLEEKPVIALLAGSRRQEIRANMPAMLEAVKGFAGGYQFIVAGAPGISPDFYRVYETGFPNVKVLFGQTYRILAQSEVALVTSGTATLETALLNVPQVVCYRTLFPRLSYLGFKMILHTPFISLVNLIMGREVVKELFAKSFSVDNIRKELHRLLHVQGYRNNMLESYRELRSKLGEPGASERAASIICSRLRTLNS